MIHSLDQTVIIDMYGMRKVNFIEALHRNYWCSNKSDESKRLNYQETQTYQLPISNAFLPTTIPEIPIIIANSSPSISVISELDTPKVCYSGRNSQENSRNANITFIKDKPCQRKALIEPPKVLQITQSIITLIPVYDRNPA